MVSAIKTVTPDIVLSANHSEAHKWLENVPIVPDKSPRLGGLSGIRAALSSRRNVVVVAWDMPFVSGDLLRAVVDAGVERGADASVPESDSPNGIEPFCAWYSISALPPLDQFLAAGGGSARDFLSRLPRVHRVPISASSRFGDPAVLFFSVNSAEDLARARAIAATAQ